MFLLFQNLFQIPCLFSGGASLIFNHGQRYGCPNVQSCHVFLGGSKISTDKSQWSPSLNLHVKYSFLWPNHLSFHQLQSTSHLSTTHLWESKLLKLMLEVGQLVLQVFLTATWPAGPNGPKKKCFPKVLTKTKGCCVFFNDETCRSKSLS